MSLDNSDNLELLEALAKVEDVGDFRLGEFMRQLGMNPGQPTIFYRKLIREARENNAFIDTILKDLFGKEEIISQLRADALAQDRELKALKAKINKLEAETHQKMGNLERERHDLLAAASELQDKVWKYDALIQLLKGEIKPHTLKALSELYWDMYMDALNAVIYGQSPPDPARLDEIRQKLREKLKDILRIPQQELEQEMDKLRARNVELEKNNTALSLSYMALRQRGWVETSPGETTEGGG